MATVVEFTTDFIADAILLWQETEHIGINDVDDEPQRIDEFLKRNAGCSFVAIEQERVVGTCLCGHDGRRGTIYHLAVRHEARQLGLADTMLRRALGALANAGIHKCHAQVFANNTNGQAFWSASGWRFRDDLNMYSAYTKGDS